MNNRRASGDARRGGRWAAWMFASEHPYTGCSLGGDQADGAMKVVSPQPGAIP